MSGEDFATRFPCYQIDFQAVATGKTIASTKRKIRWRFGYPNRQALAAGRTGVDCRGEEHDVVVIWSITSGKRQVYMDGTEIHFSSSRAGTFQYSWSGKGNHVMKILCHASPAVNPGVAVRQYDLTIDGQSFFIFPKSYEIGVSGPTARSHGYRSSPSRSGGVSSPRNLNEEDADLQRAISASLQESRQYLSTKESGSRGAPAPPPAAPTADFDLMSLEGPTPGAAPPPPQQQAYALASPSNASYNSMPPSYDAPPPAQYVAQPPPNGYQQSPGYASQPPPANAYQSYPPAGPGALVVSHTPSQPYAVPPPTPASYQAPPAFSSPQSAAPSYASPQPAAPAGYGAPPPGPPAYGAPPPQQYAPVATGNLFAPPPVDAFAARAPGTNDPYGLASPVVDDPFAPKPPPPPTRQDVTNSILNQYGGQPQPGQPPYPGHPGQPMPPANGQPPVTSQALTMNGYSATNEPEEQLSELEKAMKKLVNVERIDEMPDEEYKLTMMKKEEDSKKKKKGKSQGLPPAATGVVGSNATLSDISRVKPVTPKNGEGVMKAPPPTAFHPDAVHAGALVVHGQGPPPIQRGFGVGYGSPPPQYNQQRW